MRLGPRARRSVRIAVSVALAVYILVDVDRGDLKRALSGVRPGLFAGALLLYIVGQVLSAYKWAVLGRSVGLDRPLAEYTRFYFIGMFFNLFGPSTVGGDVVRALYLGEGRRRGVALNSVLFDRGSGLALLMALAATGLLLFPGYGFPWPLTVGIVGGSSAPARLVGLPAARAAAPSAEPRAPPGRNQPRTVLAQSPAPGRGRGPLASLPSDASRRAVDSRARGGDDPAAVVLPDRLSRDQSHDGAASERRRPRRA